MAMGAKTVMDVAPGAREHAMPFSTFEDATALAARLDEMEKRGGRARAVVVGGGYAGVEMASVLGERLGPRGEVQIITPRDGILDGDVAESQRAASIKALEANGVKTVAGARVSEVAAGEGDVKVVSIDGPGGARAIECDVVIWTAGQKPAGVTEQGRPLGPFPSDAAGATEIEPTLRVAGQERVFAVGDVALSIEGQERLSATAQVAFQQADYCAWNLWCSINGRPMLPFRYQHLGSLMTLGKLDAAMTLPVGGITLDGAAGQVARRLVYLYRQPTNEHRVKVGASMLAKPLFNALGQEVPNVDKLFDTVLGAARQMVVGR
mmetsp:Transcript_70230/g.222674  ORF Transcript_70230/g.222674 Transcript_70230/m.222674 type:complete len:322 (-) Transcript_70230:50-1015(-)